VSAEVEKEVEAPALDINAMGGYSGEDVAASAYARVLMLGPSKRGKTTSILTTAPKPVILNADGDESATHYAATICKRNNIPMFNGFDVRDRASWRAGIDFATKLVDAGVAQTVLVDTATLLAFNVWAEVSLKLEGFEIWNEVERKILGGLQKLFELPAHVFVTAHMDPGGKDSSEGIMPLIGGRLKRLIPAVAHDVVLFDYVQGRNPERMFLVGPQGEWNYSGRNVRRSTAVPATVPALFEELGIVL
jgi:AAA domain-containing protein